MNRNELKAAVEALVFVAEEPVTLEQLAIVLDPLSPREIEEALSEIDAECRKDDRGLQLQRVAGGWRLTTRAELYPVVSEFLKRRRAERLSRAALETLAVIAYRQPVTAPEVQGMRGVDPEASIKTLLDRGLVRILGRKKVVGKPFLYGTTQEFLVHFGLNTLDDLPSLEEFETVLAERYRLDGVTPGLPGVEAPPETDEQRPPEPVAGEGGAPLQAESMEFWDEAAAETARAAECRRRRGRGPDRAAGREGN